MNGKLVTVVDENLLILQRESGVAIEAIVIEPGNQENLEAVGDRIDLWKRERGIDAAEARRLVEEYLAEC